MKFAVFFLCFVAIYFAGSNLLLASEQRTPLEPIIINSSRIPTTLDNSITNTLVIDKEAIASSQASNVSDLLRFNAGIHVQQSGSRGAFNSIFLRNSDPNLVAVIIDGVKVNDPTNSRGGGFDFSSIDINSVERIEIVKGAMSSAYGSDALAGVIYITTLQADQNKQGQVSYTTGRKMFNEATAGIQNSIGQTDVSMNVAYVDEGEQTQFSGFINRTANLNTNSYFGEGKKLSVRGRYNESDASSLPDDSGGEQYAVIRETDSRDIREASLGATYYHDVIPEWSFSLALSQFTHDERHDSPGVAPGVRSPIPANTSDSQFKRKYISWNNNIEFSRDIQLSVGLDSQHDTGNSDGSLDTGMGIFSGSFSLKQKNQGVFLETLFGNANSLTAKLGIRYDSPEEFSDQATANLGLRYRNNLNVFTVSAGSAYKLPSFFSLGNFMVGNADLAPEESRYWEIGLKRASVNRRLQWKIAVYSYEYKNLIVFDAVAFSMENRDKVTSDGIELDVSQKINGQNEVSIGIAYSDTNIVGSSEKLYNRPDWRLTSQYHHTFSNTLSSSLLLTYVDQVYESSVPTGEVTLDSYYRLDLAINLDPGKNWKYRVKIENLTNQSYEETVGTKSPGASARLSAIASF